MTVTPYIPPTWFHPLGAKKCAKRIEEKGLPDMRDWRFVTLTLDRESVGDPGTGYDLGCDRMRRFLDRVRQVYGPFKWAWKLEAHPDNPDWVHWHLLLSIPHKVDLDLFNKAWGLGRTNVRRCKSRDMKYIVKYALKGGHIPSWMLARKRVRFWQTCKDFYTAPKAPSSSAAAKAPKTQNNPISQNMTIGDRLKLWARCVLLHFERDDGRSDVRRQYLDDCNFGGLVQLIGMEMGNLMRQGRHIKYFNISQFALTLPRKYLEQWGVISHNMITS